MVGSESFRFFLEAAKAANEIVFAFLGYSFIQIFCCFLCSNILFSVAAIEFSFLFRYELETRSFLYVSEKYQNYLTFWYLGLNFFFYQLFRLWLFN